MRILIADDEPVARQVLRELLDGEPGIAIVGEAADGAEALRRIEELRPDAVLLDLHMPGLDGLQVTRSLDAPQAPAVIFVTAHPRHALEAFDAGAVDYLMKPVRKERLDAALAKAQNLLAGRVRSAPPPADAPAGRAAAPPSELRRIAGRLGADIHLIDLSEVIAFQAEGDVVYILATSGRYYAGHTLKALEERLPATRFRRVHRATIINTDQIRRISPLSSKRWLLKMSNGLEVVVSKRLAGSIRGEAW